MPFSGSVTWDGRRVLGAFEGVGFFQLHASAYGLTHSALTTLGIPSNQHWKYFRFEWVFGDTHSVSGGSATWANGRTASTDLKNEAIGPRVAHEFEVDDNVASATIAGADVYLIVYLRDGNGVKLDDAKYELGEDITLIGRETGCSNKHIISSAASFTSSIPSGATQHTSQTSLSALVSTHKNTDDTWIKVDAGSSLTWAANQAIAASNWHLTGGEGGAKPIADITGDIVAINISSEQDQIRIGDIEWAGDGDGTVENEPLIDILTLATNQATDISIVRNKITGGHGVVEVGNGQDRYLSDRISIIGNELVNRLSYGIVFWGTKALIADNLVPQNTNTAPTLEDRYHSFRGAASEGLYITNNDFESPLDDGSTAGHALKIHSFLVWSVQLDTKEVNITNNAVRSRDECDWCVAFMQQGGNYPGALILDLNFEGNLVEGNGDSDQYLLIAEVERGRLANNVFVNNSAYEFFVGFCRFFERGHTTGFPDVNGAKEWHIVFNTFHHTNQNASNTPTAAIITDYDSAAPASSVHTFDIHGNLVTRFSGPTFPVHADVDAATANLTVGTNLFSASSSAIDYNGGATPGTTYLNYRRGALATNDGPAASDDSYGAPHDGTGRIRDWPGQLGALRYQGSQEVYSGGPATNDYKFILV